ncbi:MAG TPA: OmpA family protein [Terriglobales bacterium]|nr:OmpA family protein [Terriglobales bacterium]
MKSRIWIALPLAATLMVPAFAQQPATTTTSQSAATQSQGDQAQPSGDSNASHQPLVMETREGFWGKVNPFARKKYVQRQLTPVIDRTNELDQLTAANSKMIRDVDSRAQEGIKMASAKATEANNNALQAGTRAQAAQQTATDANNRLQTVQQVVTNIDLYKPVTQVEIRFRAGQTALSKQAKEALDQLAAQLKDQKGYVVEVQGFAPGRGNAGIESSGRMAQSVARYLIANYDVPLYRMRVLGVGNVATQTADGKPNKTSRVEISLLKNDLEQLSSSQPVPAQSSNATSQQ